MQQKFEDCVLIVLFHPDSQQLKALIAVLKEEGVNVIFIDNTPLKINKDLMLLSENTNLGFDYLPLKKNKGIAEAQNVGIRLALKNHTIQNLLFLDQDSIISRGFVKKMKYEYLRIKRQGIDIAALGPMPIKEESFKKYKQEVVSNKNRGDGFNICSTLISSGMFMSRKSIECVGLMESKLFIDMVDFEWCWRAKSKGYVCCMSNNITMIHKVGIEDRTYLGFAILISSPTRYYYQFRNYILLITRTYVPTSWKLKNFIKKGMMLVYIPLFTKDGSRSLLYMIKGIKSGFASALKINKVKS